MGGNKSSGAGLFFSENFDWNGRMGGGQRMDVLFWCTDR